MNRYTLNNLFLVCMFLLVGCASSNLDSPGAVNSTIALSDTQEATLDLENFIGQRIALPGKFSSHVTDINLSLIFPDQQQYKLLPKAKPNIELYTKDGKLILKKIIQTNQAQYLLNQKINSDKIYAKIGVFYCKLGDEGLCLMQNILYEIMLTDSLEPGSLHFEYSLPGSYF